MISKYSDIIYISIAINQIIIKYYHKISINYSISLPILINPINKYMS